MTMVMATLRAEASTEVSRLLDARTRTPGGDENALAQLEADGPWIVIARRTRVRRRLNRRVLLLWRVTFEDASGRVAESRLTAIAIQLRPPPPRRVTRAWIETVLQAIDADVRAAVEGDTRGWSDAAAAAVQSFSATRLERERAIARARATVVDAFQPGLFDRRAEHLRQLHARSVADGDRGAAARIAAIEQASVMVLRPARLLLVAVA